MPALVVYQILDQEPPFPPTVDRAVIEERARACLTARADGTSLVDGLDALVVETRYNVVRSNLPHEVAAVHRLRDYLPPAEAEADAARVRADGGRTGAHGGRAQSARARLRPAVAELVIGP